MLLFIYTGLPWRGAVEAAARSVLTARERARGRQARADMIRADIEPRSGAMAPRAGAVCARARYAAYLLSAAHAGAFDAALRCAISACLPRALLFMRHVHAYARTLRALRRRRRHAAAVTLRLVDLMPLSDTPST